MEELKKVNEQVETKAVVKNETKVNAEVVNCVRLNVRVAPTKTAEVVSVISKGDRVKVNKSEMSNFWANITLVDGKAGYVMTEYLKLV